MPSRTDDPRPARTQLETRPDSSLAVSPASGPEVESSDDELFTQESFLAVCSSNQRGGRWEAADEIQARAIAGEIVLDFTRAELPPSGLIDIHAWAICGQITIIVPDGAEVEIDAEPLLGSVEHQVRKKGEVDADRPAPSTPGAPAEPPCFRIDGRAILGSIAVKGS